MMTVGKMTTVWGVMAMVCEVTTTMVCEVTTTMVYATMTAMEEGR
jgi:hypothetical protein